LSRDGRTGLFSLNISHAKDIHRKRADLTMIYEMVTVTLTQLTDDKIIK
jgi:hypothetical protein